MPNIEFISTSVPKKLKWVAKIKETWGVIEIKRDIIYTIKVQKLTYSASFQITQEIPVPLTASQILVIKVKYYHILSSLLKLLHCWLPNWIKIWLFIIPLCVLNIYDDSTVLCVIFLWERFFSSICKMFIQNKHF